ncbi:hypothetical protein NCS52_01512100 [Fusarium sp. LHS14.1]|nr:hypothetical protein NCS52_01512100 [Fusarium sp. LHS14.1]
MGFLIEDFAIMVRILDRDDHDALGPIAKLMRGILVKAAPGLAKGGIHTPNHRWKICSALARISNITGHVGLIKRIDEWLAEGIDIDADGIYSERSPNYYSAVSNPSLFTNFYAEFRELALLDNNGRFAAIARLIEKRLGPQLGDFLANLIERPEPAAQLPKSEDLFVDFEKHYASAGLVPFGGSDWYNLDGKKTDFYNRMGSGLSTNPTMFRAWNGKAVLEAVRLSANFFSMGHFRSNGIELTDDGVITLAGERDRDHRHENGTYDLSKSVDGRFYAMLDFTNRPTSVRRLKTDVKMTQTKAGYDLDFEVTGEDDVELTFELTFREGGNFTGVDEFIDSDEITEDRLVEGRKGRI